MRAKSAKPKYDAPAARMVVRLVEELCASEAPLGVTELVQKLGSNANMVFRLLQTLEREGWVSRVADGPKYAVGLRPYHFASKPVRRLRFRQAAEAPLAALHAATRQSCYLGIADGTRTLMVEHLDALEGDIRLSAQPGGRYPMHCAAPGKVLLAFGGEGFARRVVAAEGLPAQTPRTITSARALEAELGRVRRAGFALDREEFAPGLLCLAAPAFGVDDRLAGAIGVSVLTLYYSVARLKEEIGPAVVAAADRISETLGATRRARQATRGEK